MAKNEVAEKMERNDWFSAIVVMLFDLVALVFVVALLVNIWDPALSKDTEAKQAVDVLFGSGEVKMSFDVALLVLAATMGALGGLIKLNISFFTFVGRNAFQAAWVGFYLSLPFLGAGLAILFYLVVRAGFLDLDSDNADAINIYGIAALSGLVGLFTREASAKLRKVFVALFTEPDALGDALPEADDKR